MGLETAPFVQDFVISNPISGDDVNQGDNHLRLIKETLKATFPTATKAMYAPVAEAKTTSYTVVAADENKSLYVDCTAGAVTITLPVLTAGAAGFNIRLLKSDATVNPIFVVVTGAAAFYSGGTSVTKARRGIPGVPFNAVWSGGLWFVERCERAPVGTSHPYAGSTLPVGYEWPNGQTLASASTNYPEYYAMRGGDGITPDMRGRAPYGKSNMGGTDNGILSLVPGTTLWGQHGAQTVTLAQANLGSLWYFSTDSFTFSGTGVNSNTNYMSSAAGGAFTNYNHRHYTVDNMLYNGSFPAGGFTITGPAQSVGNGNYSDYVSVDHYHDYSFTPAGTINHGWARAGGSDTAVNKLPPLIVLNFILVVE